jgi:hypothetical protein
VGLNIFQADITMKMCLLDFSLLSELFLILILCAVYSLNEESHVAACPADVFLDFLPQLQVFEKLVPHGFIGVAEGVIELLVESLELELP